MVHAPKFVCDEMLKKLARWLRILGFDTTDPSVEDDHELVVVSNEEKRILLTRDKDLSRMNNVEAIRIFSDDLDEQLAQILDLFPPSEYHVQCTRCPTCNGGLGVRMTQIIDKDGEDQLDVPPDIVRRYDRIFICEGCRKAYWTGSHWEQILNRLERIGVTPLLPREQ